MPRGTLTIYDVPAEIRARGAAETRKQLIQALAQPHLTQQQREEIQSRLQWCAKWENLQVEEVVSRPEVSAEAPTLPAPSPPQGVNHTVEVEDSLSVVEDS